jgi:hypothetical protein
MKLLWCRYCEGYLRLDCLKCRREAWSNFTFQGDMNDFLPATVTYCWVCIDYSRYFIAQARDQTELLLDDEISISIGLYPISSL